jgi:hypothetical protein
MLGIIMTHSICMTRVLFLGLLMTGLASVAFPATAGPTRDDVMANLQRCAGFTDDRTWLNCYYGAAQPMRAQLGLPSAPDSQVSLIKNTPMPAPQPMTNTASKSGSSLFDRIANFFDTSSSSTDSDFGAGATRLAAYSFSKNGLFTITLPDGDVWTQSPYDNLRARWSGLAANYTVMVSTDTMGNHTLRVKDDHDYGVVRVK